MRHWNERRKYLLKQKNLGRNHENIAHKNITTFETRKHEMLKQMALENKRRIMENRIEIRKEKDISKMENSTKIKKRI